MLPPPASRRILLEVCLTSVDGALTARGHGADRLELCAALQVGGLTPSLGTLLDVKQAVPLPVMVLIRPRPGGFAYSDAEFRAMLRDVDLFLENGADGIVCGVLLPDGTVDMDRCRELVRCTGARTPVFHRAFDIVPDPFAALEQIVDLGFRRILTSGQQATAHEGTALIAELVRRAAGRIEILPAGGINQFTAADLIAHTGCDQVHGSLREQDTTSPEAVAAIRAVLDAL